MKITNRLGLPDAIVQAVVNDDYSRGECDLSVTQLIAPPRLVELARLHEAELEEDAADRIWLLMGKIAHGILERAETQAITEERLFMNALGWRISGAFDHLALEQTGGDWWTVSDYKVTSVWSVKHADGKSEWAEQLNCYAHLLRQHSFKVSKVQIVAICRDWRKRDAAKYAHEGYPKHQVAVLRMPLWSASDTQDFIEQRVRLHQAARERLPYCSPIERWQKPTIWALMKKGQKRAVKLYQTQVEAARVASDAPALLSVEKRPGLPVRCQDYCAVAMFCQARQDGQFDGVEMDEAAA